MMGQHNSVVSRLRESCPGIFLMKCVCHSAHLCASEACKQLPRALEDMARNIFNFLKSSSKRQAELKQFQMFLNLKPHKMLHPSQTRWLSLIAVVSRILEQWDSLKLYFTDTYLSQRLISTETIYYGLNDPFMKLGFLFLNWSLPLFTRFNMYFQTEQVVILELHDKIINLSKEILLCFLKRSYVLQTPLDNINPNNGEFQLIDSGLYLGVGVMDLVNDPKVLADNVRRKDFFKRCRDFFIVAAMEIKKRYNMSDPVLSKLHMLKPENAISHAFRETSPTLLNLIKVLPRVVTEPQMIQIIDDGWRCLPILVSTLDYDIIVKSTDPKTKVVPADLFWTTIKKLFSECEILANYALIILSLPHSNANCERVFSSVNCLKTKLRSRLNTTTINGVLHAKQNIKSSGSNNCVKFTPTDDMLSRMTKKLLYISDSHHDLKDYPTAAAAAVELVEEGDLAMFNA
ncbi:uncharacterized protein LOC126555629 [Aphis gossypii]|uniref:uncharacterized protein LOC126555629 n=1 Tax=Aphis gossypii TaxID=80765 RepID=UPI0021594276|nr:uncharacterized protein LOC126555629 [Aphis gossypii]